MTIFSHFIIERPLRKILKGKYLGKYLKFITAVSYLGTITVSSFIFVSYTGYFF